MADQTIPAYPATPRRPVSDSYHGVTVTEATAFGTESV